MVMAQALFKLLKHRDPDRVLDVLAPAWSLPIVARMPEIRRGIASETGHGEIGLGKRRRIAKALSRENYDRAIVMPRSFKSALIPWFAGIPSRTGFRGETRLVLLNDRRPFDRNRLDQTVKRFVALGLDLGEALPESLPDPSLTVSRENQARVLAALGIESDRPVVAMMPGAEYGPAKCWPHEYFAEVAGKLEQSGYAVWVLGSEKDAAAGDAIANASKAINLCGKTSLEDVIDLLALCEQVVSNDSGLMHIAAAVGTHVHALYGSSSSKFTPPLTKSRDIHQTGIACSPCFERDCPLGHLKCLKDLRPDTIFSKILKKSA
jgi:heptosyltransferase-2